jgi:hypothetical protein
MIQRRTFLVALAAGLAGGVADSHAQDVGQWYPLVGDNGRPVANTRLPVELTQDVVDLQARSGSDRKAGR